MSPIEVLFCRENLTNFGNEAWQLLTAEQRPELHLVVVKCIIACSECATLRIARVNGQLVTAETAEGLVQMINQLMIKLAETSSE